MNYPNEIFLKFAEPGHFYSPIPDLREVEQDKSRIFNHSLEAIPGIKIDTRKIKNFIAETKNHITNMPFQENQTSEHRYYFKNPFFSYGDATIAYSMLCSRQPKKIIEIGSGFSSALLLDCNDINFNSKIEFTFIDPYPERLLSLLSQNDNKLKIYKKRSQDIDTSEFASLEANDILFIDSSHVAKAGSDVNDHLTRILPSLKQGVIIHFHDIFWPFEYPEDWITSGRAWNEAYILRSFLQYNTLFEIEFFNSYAAAFCKSELEEMLPVFMKNSGGSIWLRKTR